MQIPILFGIIIIIIIWLQYEIKKSKNHSTKSHEDFWKLENQSNLTKRIDISNLEYITILLERLPMTDHEDSTINSYRDIILKLSDKKILNLTGQTNTELKLKYGTANINLLSEYDNNYTSLVSILQKWGERLYLQGSVTDAVTVLEFAVSCNSDVSKSYKLLATIYMEQKTPEKIDELIHTLSNIKMLRKDIIIEELLKMKSL